MTNFKNFSLLPVLCLLCFAGCQKQDIEPVASFDYHVEDDLNIAPASVKFTNSSSFASSYQWDFGDGSSSQEQNPQHVFSEPGTYQVTLTAISGSQQHMAMQTVVLKDFRQLSKGSYHYNAYTYDIDGKLVESSQGNIALDYLHSDQHTIMLDFDSQQDIIMSTQIKRDTGANFGFNIGSLVSETGNGYNGKEEFSIGGYQYAGYVDSETNHLQLVLNSFRNYSRSTVKISAFRSPD